MLHAAVFQAERTVVTTLVATTAATAVIPTTTAAVLPAARIPSAVGAAVAAVPVEGEGIPAYLIERMARDNPHTAVMLAAINDVHKDASFLELVHPMLTERRRCVFYRILLNI